MYIKYYDMSILIAAMLSKHIAGVFVLFAQFAQLDQDMRRELGCRELLALLCRSFVFGVDCSAPLRSVSPSCMSCACAKHNSPDMMPNLRL